MLLFLIVLMLWFICTVIGVIYFNTIKNGNTKAKEQRRSISFSSIDSHKMVINPLYLNQKNEINYETTAVVSLLAIYNSSTVEPFFYSLRRTGYSGEIICFTLNTDIGRYRKLYEEYDVKYVLFQNKYPYYISNNKHYPISSKLLRNISNIPSDSYFYANIRFFLIYFWLVEYHSNFSYILMSDIRDSLFQRNPFEWNYNRGIYLTHETLHCKYYESKTCCRCNYDWFTNLNPPDHLLNNTFINAGQIFGSSAEMRDFLKEFTEMMYNIHLKNRKRVYTCDQGILNLYIYNKTEFSFPVFLFEAEHGFARNIGLDLISNKYGFEPNDNLTIVNQDDTVPVVIHQYDVGLKHGSAVRRIKYRKYYQHYIDI